MLKSTFLTILFFFLSTSLFAQDLDNFLEQNKTVPFQKIYLHTDRDFYFYGDTLWFAAYLVDGNSHKPTESYCNLYVDLVDSGGLITKKETFAIENGRVPGYLSFADADFKEGNYLLRAYTDYSKNFGDDSFFEKTITLSETKNSFEVFQAAEKNPDSIKIDIQFFPEGGFLLANQKNRIAFKAINQFGKEIEIEGNVKNEKGDFICSFSSKYKGMGEFFLRPSNKTKYRVEIKGYPGYTPEFPKVISSGAKVIATEINRKHVNFKVSTNEKQSKRHYYVVLTHRGKETYFLELDKNNVNKDIHVKTDSLKEGINRIVLLNSKLEPLSERLVFVDLNQHIDLDFTLNKQQFETREKVKIQINTELLPESEMSNLSVAVVNENALNAEGSKQNIKSYLLVDSELNGPISSPAGFFNDDENLTSAAKLDLLMLTQGWKNYIWNNLKQQVTPLPFKHSLGFNINGKVLKQSGKKTHDNAQVVLGVKNKNSGDFYTASPDSKGNFAFNNVLIYDMVSVFLQGKNHKGKTRTHLELDSTEYSASVNFNKVNVLNYSTDIPLAMYRLNFDNSIKLKEFYPDKDSRVIEEIEVKAEKPEEDDGHHRIYEKPRASFEIDEMDLSYTNIFEFLRIRVPGVRVFGDKYRGYIITIGPPNGADPLLLLNGMRTDLGVLMFLNMQEVDNIDILKGNEAAIYGSRGAGGILSVWTKRAELRDPASILLPPGTIVKRIKGFAPYREFYSPKYTAENIESEAPDVRTTLYWNPNIELKNGKAELSFFTCDNIARYKIFVEGISESGKICLGIGEFVVDQHPNIN